MTTLPTGPVTTFLHGDHTEIFTHKRTLKRAEWKRQEIKIGASSTYEYVCLYDPSIQLPDVLTLTENSTRS